MYNLLAITNRHLCSGDFLEQLEKILSYNYIQNTKYTNKNVQSESNGKATSSESDLSPLNHSSLESILYNSKIKIVLREKDLSVEDYESLAQKVLYLCKDYDTECILHTYHNTSKNLNCKNIHVPLHILRENTDLYKDFLTIGVSIHSVTEAKEAEKLHASYITAGHIFKTDCKKGLPGRGLDFLKEVVKSVHIPVYAIGGINEENIDKVIECGAYGACIMSGFMSL